MSKPLRVLMVEDSEDDALLTILALEMGGFDPAYERVENAEAMWKALLEKPWDVILCDYQLPQFNGFAAIDLLKETGIDIPLIIVSGAIGEETAADCMRLGAFDYIMKSNLSRLVPAIERELKEAESRRQRKRAEEALRESEEKYRTLIQKIQIAVVVHGPDTRILTCNPKAQELLGLTEDQLIGKTAIDPDWYFFKTDGTVMSVEEYPVNQVISRRQTLSDFILGVHNPNKEQGNKVWVLVNAVPVFVNDEIGQVIVTFVDITDRKLAEEALLASETKYRGILENLDDAYFEIDLKGNFVFFNKALVSQTGYSREELVGMNYRKYMSPEMAKTVSMIFSEIYKTGQPVRLFEYEIIMKNGQLRNNESWTSIVFDDNGKPIGFRGVARDITKRKLAEGQLKNTLENLRKAFIASIQLMVSAVEARDPYTAGHQIRTTNLARAIATEMGLPQEKIEGLRMAGAIHDIGKISIPAELLSKPTKPTNVEFSLIKEHARIGYEMLKDVESPWPLAEIVHQHHERMDGSGYPRNLKGNEIIMEARILAVADVVEAMASHRPYRPAIGIEAALEEIEKNKGILYDDAVADACLRLFREKCFQLEKT